MVKDSVTVGESQESALNTPEAVGTEHGSASRTAEGPLLRDGVQAPISCTPQIVNNPVLSCGIDTLHMSLRLDVPAQLLEKLENAKKEVQTTAEDCESVQFGETKLFSWAIQRTGAPKFPYVLRTGDITLKLSNRPSDSPIWNAGLQIGSLSCNNDLDGLLSSLKLWFKHYGVKWVQDIVSRIDMYTDVETNIQSTGIDKQDHHVTRATTCATYHSSRHLTGVQIGKSEIVLRIYDKLQEMKEKRATEKEMFFIEKWGKNPESVTRVEFQLRRPAVVELFGPGSTDWQSIKPALPGVYAYLVNWFRHTEESVAPLRESNNQHLAESSSFWKKVEQAADSWRDKFGKIIKIFRDKKQKHLNIAPLVEQAAGCLMSVVAALGHAHDDLFGIFATCRELIQDKITENMEKATYEKQYYARAALATVSF